MRATSSAFTRPLRLAATLLAVLVALAALAAQPAPGAPPAARVMAIGDIHGDFDAFTTILRRAGLVNGRRWAGGNATLVQTGDFTDRGPKVRAVMELLMSLEQQAPEAGGRVIVLLGNHEALNLIGDLKYVSADTYAEFADAKSEERREAAYRAYAEVSRRQSARLQVGAPLYGIAREAWLADRPAGFIEYTGAIAPNGRYGRWLRSKDVVAKVGDTLFLHAGIPPDLTNTTIDEINARVRREIRAFDAVREQLVADGVAVPSFGAQQIAMAAALDRRARAANDGGDERDRLRDATLRTLAGVDAWWLVDPEGPLWFRGYAQWTPAQGDEYLPRLLSAFGVAHIVTAHSPVAPQITVRFGGRIFLIDTGMLAAVYRGRPSALERQGERFTAIYPDERVPLDGASR